MGQAGSSYEGEGDPSHMSPNLRQVGNATGAKGKWYSGSRRDSAPVARAVRHSTDEFEYDPKQRAQVLRRLSADTSYMAKARAVFERRLMELEGERAMRDQMRGPSTQPKAQPKQGKARSRRVSTERGGDKKVQPSNAPGSPQRTSISGPAGGEKRTKRVSSIVGTMGEVARRSSISFGTPSPAKQPEEVSKPPFNAMARLVHAVFGQSSLIQDAKSFSQLCDKLIEHFKIEAKQVGETLFEQGDAGMNAYIVKEGNVNIEVKAHDGKPHVIASYGAGGHFGELALMYKHNRAGTARCTEPTVVWSLDRESLQMAFEKNLGMQINAWEALLRSLPLLSPMHHSSIGIFARSVCELELHMKDGRMDAHKLKSLMAGISSKSSVHFALDDVLVMVTSGRLAATKADGSEDPHIFGPGDILGCGSEADRVYMQQAKIACEEDEIKRKSAVGGQHSHRSYDAPAHQVWLLDGRNVSEFTFSASGGTDVHALVISMQHFVKLHLSCLFRLPKLTKMLNANPSDRRDSDTGQLEMVKAKTSSLRVVLAQVPWLARLENDKLEMLVEKFEMKLYPKGKAVIEQGGPSEQWIMLLHGAVQVSVTVPASEPDGAPTQRKLCQLHAIASLGERGILYDCPATANAVAIDECVCALLPKAVFLQVLSPRMLTLLKSSLPPPSGVNSGDAPPMQTGEHRKYGLRKLHYHGLLGKGSFGKVYAVSAHHDKERPLALKCVSMSLFEGPDADDPKVILRERAIMCQLDHPFVPRLYATFKDAQYVYFLMDHYSCGTLEDLQLSRPKNQLKVKEAMYYTAQIVSMCEYLHRRGVIHRDLKTQNLLLDGQGNCNLIDFGLAANLQMGERTYTVCGSPMYVAPEVLKKTGHAFEVDWWSLGVMMYYFLVGCTPFTSGGTVKSVPRLFRNIVSEEFQIDYPPELVPDECRSLIATLLQRNPPARVGFQVHNGALFIKQQEWFNELDWEALMKKELPAPFLPNELPLDVDPDMDLMHTIPPLHDDPEPKGCACFGGGAAQVEHEPMWYDAF